MEDTEFYSALLAIRPRLTSGEFSVAIARRLGHVTHFDIKRKTGIDADRIKAAESSLATKCGVSILRILGLSTKYIPKVAPRIVAAPPSQRVLQYLLTSIERVPVPHATDYKGFNKAYDLAYEYAKHNHAEAMTLLYDVVDFYADDFRKTGKYPGSFLYRLTDLYLSNIPKKLPLALYERAQLKKIRFRYNPKTKQWEERK